MPSEPDERERLIAAGLVFGGDYDDRTVAEVRELAARLAAAPLPEHTLVWPWAVGFWPLPEPMHFVSAHDPADDLSSRSVVLTGPLPEGLVRMIVRDHNAQIGWASEPPPP